MEINLLEKYLSSKKLTEDETVLANDILLAFQNTSSQPIRCFLVYLLLTKLEGISKADQLFHKVISL